MHRRIAPLLLAVLLALPSVEPASAGEPTASPPTDAAVGPAPAPEPTAVVEPTPSPTPAEDPVEPFPPSPTDLPSDPALPSDLTASPPSHVPPDAEGRFIVMLRSGSDTAAVVEKARKRGGVKADKSYSRAIRGFAAKLDKKQRLDLLADPNVVAIVPDEVVQVAAQTVPTGVSRVGGLLSDVAAIDGSDARVDADVAIVDTGLSYHPDLNVAGGYNCSTSDRSAWRDRHNHGTHVAGTVGAIDNGLGVVGVAPGARVWGVKILNDEGEGLLSWYICGLDWILSQRDPSDATRPLFEAVNMSVTKYGSDDRNCGLTNDDPLHRAICRVVGGGITVVAAAANDSHSATRNIPASYDEVITVSALADSDGQPGGTGGNRCYSWNSYDVDDTFADFSNYGYDVDLIAPGKCILSTIPGSAYRYMSGTSMAAPTVAGAVALYKASRPKATPAEVREALRWLGNLDWAVETDPDPTHEPLLDVSRIGVLGTFTLGPAVAPIPVVEGGATVSIPVTITRSPTFFEPVALSAGPLPDGWTGLPATVSAFGWDATDGRVSVVVAKGTPPGRYEVGVVGTNQGRTVTGTVAVDVIEDEPTANAPAASLIGGIKMGRTSLTVRVAWAAATDPSSAIAGYEVQASANGGAWTSTQARTADQLSADYRLAFDASYRFRVRAVDAGDNWSPWVESETATQLHPVDDRSSAVVRRGHWLRRSSVSALRATVTGSTHRGDTLTLSFTGHGVAVVGPRNPYRGKAQVWIDGVYARTISMKSSAWTSRQVVFTRSLPDGGRHTIQLRALGTGRYPLFRLDAFVVHR